MVILGIDPGLANTGWGVVETRGPLVRARAYGCISSTSDEPIDMRLGRIFREISQVILKYGPTDLAIEKIFFGQNAKSAIPTAQARGAAIAACAAAGLSVGEYSPAEIKQSLVGTGSAEKEQITFMVRHLLALDHDPKPDHAADALAAAVCHAHLSQTASATQTRTRTVMEG